MGIFFKWDSLTIGKTSGYINKISLVGLFYLDRSTNPLLVRLVHLSIVSFVLTFRRWWKMRMDDREGPCSAAFSLIWM